jgi:hypothetical protein
MATKSAPVPPTGPVISAPLATSSLPAAKQEIQPVLVDASQPISPPQSLTTLTPLSPPLPGAQPPAPTAVPPAQPPVPPPQPPVVPALVLTQQKSSKGGADKKSQNTFAIVGAKKSTQSSPAGDDGRRVTRHSPQNVTNNTGSPGAKSTATKTTTNGRAAAAAANAAALLAPLASKSKAQPVVAHKRSPSSPVPPHLAGAGSGNQMHINPSLVRATKSQPTPVLKAAFLAAQKSSSGTLCCVEGTVISIVLCVCCF